MVSIGKYAFSGCKGLQSIYISDGVESIFHYAFKDCIDLVDVVIGSSVKEIKMEAFKNCSNLETLVLGESIEDMGSFVVENCKRIKWIEARSEFPASIHKTTFYLGASSTKTYMDIFNNVPLYVPKGCKTRYENAPEWQHFKNIIERDEEDAIACVERNRMFDTFYSIDGKKAISSDKGIIVVQSKNKKSRKVIRK